MAQQPKKELCIKCGKKPPAIVGELWCSTCYNKLLKQPKKIKYETIKVKEVGR